MIVGVEEVSVFYSLDVFVCGVMISIHYRIPEQTNTQVLLLRIIVIVKRGHELLVVARRRRRDHHSVLQRPAQ